MTKNLAKVLPVLLPLLAIPALTACGGGGGGGSDFVGAAQVSIDVNPSRIDIGDRARVTTDIFDVHPDGIILKFKMPLGVGYVRDSGLITVDGDDHSIDPDENQSDGNFRYLVYFFSQDDFGSDHEGQVQFEIEGKEEVADGEVQVDPDVDNVRIPNDQEFDINSPEFGAEDADSIEVVN